MAENQRNGRISLWTSLAGVIFPSLLGFGFSLWTERDIVDDFGLHFGLCTFLSVVLEMTALRYGLMSSGTEAGRTGLRISLAAFLLLGFITVFTVGTVHERAAPAQKTASAIRP